jgi:hypothetical protein
MLSPSCARFSAAFSGIFNGAGPKDQEGGRELLPAECIKQSIENRTVASSHSRGSHTMSLLSTLKRAKIDP